MNDHMGGTRVANHVGERFLKNPEERCRQIGSQHRFAQIGMNVTFNSGPRLKFVCLPLECGDKPKMVEYARAQLGGNPPDRLNGGVYMNRKGLCFLLQGREIGGQFVCEQRQIEFATGQCLAEFVVDFTGNAGPLLLADVLQVNR